MISSRFIRVKMMVGVFSFCVMLIMVEQVDCTGSKYSVDHNLEIKDAMTQIKPFKMNKVNILWLTARKKKHLSMAKQEELFFDLQEHERLERKLKKLRAANLDRDGAVETKALYNFKRIVEKFALEDEPIKVVKEMKDSSKKKVTFEDAKLQDMWTHAQESGFSDTDLSLLQEEFSHQQMKIDEFNMEHGALDNILGGLNDILDEDDDVVNDKDKVWAKRKDKSGIIDGYKRLEQLHATMTPTGGEFSDPRVNSLWNLAQKSKWSEEKLDSFKEELKHFEKRLSKQKHYADELKFSRQSLDIHHSPEKHKFLEEKTQELSREIKKYHSGLKERVGKAIRHSEL